MRDCIQLLNMTIPVSNNGFLSLLMLKMLDVTGAHLTHWDRVTHICVGNLTTIGSDNGLSPGRHQAIIWTNAGILLIGPLWTNFSNILIEIPTFSFKKMRLKVSSAKWRPFCLGLNVLIPYCKAWQLQRWINTLTHLSLAVRVKKILCAFCRQWPMTF